MLAEPEKDKIKCYLSESALEEYLTFAQKEKFWKPLAKKYSLDNEESIKFSRALDNYLQKSIRYLEENKIKIIQKEEGDLEIILDGNEKISLKKFLEKKDIKIVNLDK